jgi:NAD dependent epimerase/dehydratase
MTYWSGRKVLVTGAGGFIGSHLTETMVREGADVRAMVHYNSAGRRGWLDQSALQNDMEIVAGDITDSGSVLSVMKDRDFVFHLAALIAIPYSYVAPASYIQANITGTLNVLEAARKYSTSRIVQTSTSEVYGTALTVPISESHPLQGQSPYSASKIGADKLAESYYRSFSVPVVTVRPFNTYGPRQSARAVLPTIITQCLSGSAVRLGSLTPTRDLNFVSDTVRGFLACASTDAAIGRTLNIGSGREISVGDLARTVAALVGVDVSIECDEQRFRPSKSEVERLLADNRLAGEVTGWKPEVTLEEGLKLTIQWFRDHSQEYQSNVYNI